MAKTLQERFDDKYEIVTESGCWMWTAYTNPAGYGMVGVGRGAELSHRVSYKLHVGEVPNGLHVLHKCDVPSCVNPNHLFLGTHQDNMDDKINKNRQHRPHQIGEDNYNSKLVAEDVLEIRDLLLNTDYRQHEIAKMYGVVRATIGYINTRSSWSHV